MGAAAKFFNGLKKGAEYFGGNIGLLVNSVLLSIAYAIGVGLTHIAAKLVGKHFLDTELSKAGTYWVDLNLKKKETKDYYRQF